LPEPEGPCRDGLERSREEGGDAHRCARNGFPQRAASNTNRFGSAICEHVDETRYCEIKEGERFVRTYSMAVNGRVRTV
jgi:hypothetical protein